MIKDNQQHFNRLHVVLVRSRRCPVPTMQRLSQRKNRPSILESLIFSEKVHPLWEPC